MNRTGFALTALMLVALVALAVTPAQAALPSLPTTAGGGIAQYMPKDCTALVTINVKRLAQTDLFDILQEMGIGKKLHGSFLFAALNNQRHGRQGQQPQLI